MTHFLLLAALIGVPWWLGSLAIHPMKPCPRCGPHAGRRGGGGRNIGSRPRRFGPCGKCGGTGRVRRLGAKSMHKSIQRVRKGLRDRKD